MNLDNTFSNFEQNDVNKSVFFLRLMKHLFQIAVPSVGRMIFTGRPSAGHVHLAACFQCRFARRTRKPNPVPAALPAVIERRPHIQDGEHFFFLPFFDVSNGKQCRSMLVSIRVCQNRNDQNRDLVAMI